MFSKILLNFIKNNDLENFEKTMKDSMFKLAIKNNDILTKVVVEKNIKMVELLINNQEVDFNKNDNLAFRTACKNNSIEIIKLLLKDNRIDATFRQNHCIRFADINDNVNVINLLFSQKNVRDSLKIYNLNLYNDFMKYSVSDKLESFNES